MSQAQPISFLQHYENALSSGTVRADPAQRKSAESFEKLFAQLVAAQNPVRRSIFKRKAAATRAAGLYVWGEVGRGKSMLMDLFVTSITPHCRTRRVHFHAFMRDVHQRLFAYRQHARGEVIEQVIAEIARETAVLCLDELQVTDVTDAMILARLFGGLMDAGVAVVFTSNRPPDQLYQGGIQREQFLRFVEMLRARMPIIEIAGATDYRLTQLQSIRQTYHYPRDEAADDFLLNAWQTITQNQPNEPLRIEVNGRVLRVDKHTHGVAWFTFAELCLRPLGASDYLEICAVCHTIILQGIPRLTREERNEARRFVTLIDALYDHRVKLIATAQTPPEEIYAVGDGTFEFARTVSRLIEMQSAAYLKLAHL